MRFTREPHQRAQQNDWAVWAFFMTNVSSFFCLNAHELLKLLFLTCVLWALVTVGILLCPSLNIHFKNTLAQHVYENPIIWNELWPLESVIFAHRNFVSSSPLQPAATALKSPFDRATKYPIFANQTSMCKSSWFCVSRLIEHIKMHRIAMILICSHTQKNATFLLTKIPIRIKLQLKIDPNE